MFPRNTVNIKYIIITSFIICIIIIPTLIVLRRAAGDIIAIFLPPYNYYWPTLCYNQFYVIMYTRDKFITCGDKLGFFFFISGKLISIFACTTLQTGTISNNE